MSRSSSQKIKRTGSARHQKPSRTNQPQNKQQQHSNHFADLMSSSSSSSSAPLASVLALHWTPPSLKPSQHTAVQKFVASLPYRSSDDAWETTPAEPPTLNVTTPSAPPSTKTLWEALEDLGKEDYNTEALMTSTRSTATLPARFDDDDGDNEVAFPDAYDHHQQPDESILDDNYCEDTSLEQHSNDAVSVLDSYDDIGDENNDDDKTNDGLNHVTPVATIVDGIDHVGRRITPSIQDYDDYESDCENNDNQVTADVVGDINNDIAEPAVAEEQNRSSASTQGGKNAADLQDSPNDRADPTVTPSNEEGLGDDDTDSSSPNQQSLPWWKPRQSHS